MALTAAQIKYLQDQRALATQQATSGAYAPLTIDNTQGNILNISGRPEDVNPAWSLLQSNYYFDPTIRWDANSGRYVKETQQYDEPSGVMQPVYKYYNPTALPTDANGNPVYINDSIAANGQTDVPDYQYVLNPNDMAASWNKHAGLSPLSADQMRSAYQYVTQSPEYDFVDLYGRVITPGTKVMMDGGYYTYNPDQSPITKGVDAEGNALVGTVNDWTLPYDTQTDANYYLPQNQWSSWKWTPTREGAVEPGVDQLEGNIFAQQQFGGAIGEGGWSAIKGISSTFLGPVLGAIAAEAGAATTASSGGMTLSEYLANGATWADLMDAGFSPAQIAVAGGVAPATSSSLADATGMSSGLANTVTNTALNAGQGAIMSAITGKDPLTGAIKGAGGTLVNSAVNGAAGSIGDWLNSNNSGTGAYTGLTGAGGNGMDTTLDYSFGGNDYSGINDTSLDYSYNPTLNTGGGGSWYDSINWGNLASAALPAISGLIGGVAANQAQNNATNAAANQYQQGLNQQLAMYMQQRADFAPYSQMGQQGVTNYNKFVSDPNAFMKSPAYMWQQDQIDKNMNRQLSARGRSNSTYGMQALGNAYGNLASQEYDKAYNRMLDPIKVGQGAAIATGNAAQNMGGAYQQTATQMAGNATQAGANNASLYSGLGAMPQNLLNTYNQQNMNQAYMNLLNSKMGA